ncbi:MAG: TonB family protein [Gemmatimonadaceae bacterium]
MADQTISYERSIEAAGIALASGDQEGAELALHAAVKAIEDVDEYRLELTAVLVRLGGLKQEMGSLSEAEEYFHRALEIGERGLGPENLGIVPALKGLGTTRLIQGNAANAEPLLTRALAISERHLGEDHPDLVILLNDLTRLYLKQMAHAFAEPLLLRMLELKRSKGDDHPEVATVLASLAAVRQALGRHESAEQLWRRVLTIRERTLAPNHFAVATALEHLAETCAARGKLSDALGLSQRALTIREATLGREHSSVRVSRERIADLELQAAEGAYETGDAHRRPVASERSSAPLELPGVAVVPLGERAVAPSGSGSMRPTLERPVSSRPLEHFVAPTASGLAMTPLKQAGTYLDVLQDIKQEIDTSEPDAPPLLGPQGNFVGAITAFVQRRRVATITGVAAIALPLAAWGVAGAVRSGQPKWVVNDAVQANQDVGPAVGLSAAEVLIGAGDSAAKAAAAKFDRAEGVADEAVVLGKLKAPTVSVRFDSIRGLGGGGAPFATNSESVMRHLTPSAALAPTPVIVAPVRARRIGQLPTPRYPAQQLRQRTSGEVRVRFDVDTTGRPVMSTFTVVSTPHPQLSNAVKQVIPTVRFEPARTPWPENKAIVETVELSFYFALPGGK